MYGIEYHLLDRAHESLQNLIADTHYRENISPRTLELTAELFGHLEVLVKTNA